MEQWEESANEYREEKRMLRVGPEELERVAKRVIMRAEDVKRGDGSAQRHSEEGSICGFNP